MPSPATYIAQALISGGYATAVASHGAWPIYVGRLPDGPTSKANAISIVDRPHKDDGRLMRGGVRQTHPGFQLTIRASTYVDGWAKADEISLYLSTIHRLSVTVNATASIIQSITVGPILPLGVEEGSIKRDLFTLNGFLTFS